MLSHEKQKTIRSSDMGFTWRREGDFALQRAKVYFHGASVQHGNRGFRQNKGFAVCVSKQFPV